MNKTMMNSCRRTQHENKLYDPWYWSGSPRRPDRTVREPMMRRLRDNYIKTYEPENTLAGRAPNTYHYVQDDWGGGGGEREISWSGIQKKRGGG